MQSINQSVLQNILTLSIINTVLRVDMKQQKSHARIHQVILQLRQKSKQPQQTQIITTISKQIHKLPKSATQTMQNSDVLSESQTNSVILPRSYARQMQSNNYYKISNIISSESLNSQRSDDHVCKRQIKTARPVSRRKVISKDKYSKTVTQKQQPFKIEAKKSDFFQQLQILEHQHFIIQKDEDEIKLKEGQIRNLKAFWGKSNIFVSLFPLQYTQCIIYNHPNILPIYGQVKLQDRRYVVSNQYKNCSLKDLIKQFGPFEEVLCKIYLFQIICGLEEMHGRKMAHNRLNTESILYNKQGQIFINVVKSTSRPLTDKDKQQKLFQCSPQILLTKNKSNSLRSDIWSIGMILLDMLFDFEKSHPKNMKFHPYNLTGQTTRQNDAIIIDNLKQLYPLSFQINDDSQLVKQIASRYDNLSQNCKDIIYQCLLLNKDERINLKSLKSHQFFER